jgi:hypothetical protein
MQCIIIETKKNESADRYKWLCTCLICAAHDPDVHNARIFVYKNP